MSLTTGECRALFQAFCQPPYVKNLELMGVIYALGQSAKVILQVEEEYAREFQAWQDEELMEIDWQADIDLIEKQNKPKRDHYGPIQ